MYLQFGNGIENLLLIQYINECVMFIFSLPNSFFLDYMSLRLNIKYSTITYAIVHVYMFFPITGT